MTETRPVFREEPYRRELEARVIAAAPGAVELDATLFYPRGGGQPGDSGVLRRKTDGALVRIADTVKGESPDGILHIPAEGAEMSLVAGDPVEMHIDWERRHVFMRIHTALHLLSAVIGGKVTGGQIGEGRGRLDFDIPEPVDKAEVTTAVNALINANHPVRWRWIDEAELEADPALVKTMSVQPPRGAGRIRVIDIPGVDLQPCGGTHVETTSEIGAVVVPKVEKKGRQNRRVHVVLREFAEPAG